MTSYIVLWMILPASLGERSLTVKEPSSNKETQLSKCDGLIQLVDSINFAIASNSVHFSLNYIPFLAQAIATE